MNKMTIFLTPTVLTFLVITVGYYFGKIKLCNISLGLAAVLICAVVAGWLISISPLNNDTVYLSSLTAAMKNLSSLGTAIFVSTIGISAGYSLSGSSVKNMLYFVYGGLIVITGFLLVKGISLIDHDISLSALLGILCGSLTSTPGMAAISEISNISSEEVTLGYGSAYLIGVISIVMFVQILTRKEDRNTKRPKLIHNDEKISFEFITQIGITAITGTLIGQAKTPFSEAAIGSSGGMLCCGLILGFLIRRYYSSVVQSQRTIAIFRNTGLVFFFAGSGIPAGLQFGTSFHTKWIIYELILTIVPISIGYVVCCILKYSNTQSASVVAGGMTSTPAVGVLIDKNLDVDLSVYTMVYIGALMTMVIGIRYLV